MIWMLYAMLGVTLLTIVFSVVVLAKQKRAREIWGAQRYDVFVVSGGQLTVLRSIPVTYELDEIEQITFSIMKAARRADVYNGIMRVVKKNGKKGGSVLFNSSVIAKKTVIVSSRFGIEVATQYLMEELRRHHIRCTSTV